MTRVTLDVNALVEGTISSLGPAAAILTAWESGQLALILSEEIILEYEEVLARPRIRQRYPWLTPELVRRAVLGLRRNAIIVSLPNVPSMIPEDPDDDVIVACAMAGGADYIVSRDHHLLRHAKTIPVPILRPEDFMATLRQPAPREGETGG